MAGIIASSSTDSNSVFQLRSGSFTRAGQSFTGNGDTLGSSVFRLAKVSSPTGNVTATIYAHSGTFGTSSVGTGSALATSDPIDITTLGAKADITFTFSGGNQIVLTNATNYVSAVEFSGGDASNLLNVFVATNNPVSGNASRYNGTWSVPGASNDLAFIVYNNVAGSVAAAPALMMMGMGT